MTSKIGRFLFCVLVFVICSLPALVFLGVRESFVDLHGVEPKVEVPPLAVRSFADRTFQKAFEDEYARNFFLRKSLLKTRNTLCEYLNLGMFHEGYSHSILEGRHGVLYEMRYLRHHMKVLDSRSIRGNETTEMLKRVSLEFADKGIDFVVVLAPDKVSMYPEDIPTYSGMLGGLRSLDTQRAVTCFLEGQGITVLDAESFLCDRKADFSDRMFPIAGTHWNALASGLVVEELLRRISREGSRYHNGRFSGVQPSREVLYHDDDLGKLLNVWHSESLQKNVSLRPVFGEGDLKSNEGSVLVIGDSYVCQIGRILKDGGYFHGHKVVVCDKRMPDASEREMMIGDLRCVIFVLNPPNAWRSVTDGSGNPAQWRGVSGILAKGLLDIAEHERLVSFKDHPEWIKGGEKSITAHGVVLSNGCFSVKLPRPGFLALKDWSCEFLIDSKGQHAFESISCSTTNKVSYEDTLYDHGTIVTVNVPKEHDHVSLKFSLKPKLNIVMRRVLFDECREMDMSKISFLEKTRKVLPRSGLSGFGKYGTWTDGSVAEMDVRISPKYRIGNSFFLEFTCQSIVDRQEVVIDGGDRQIATWQFENMTIQKQGLSIPAELVDRDVVRLRFRIKKTVCPYELGTSPDRRHLGIKFLTARIIDSSFVDPASSVAMPRCGDTLSRTQRKLDSKIMALHSFNNLSSFVADPVNLRCFRFDGNLKAKAAYLRFRVPEFNPSDYKLQFSVRARPELLKNASLRTARSQIKCGEQRDDIMTFSVDMKDPRSFMWSDGACYVGVALPLTLLRDGDVVELIDFKFSLR